MPTDDKKTHTATATQELPTLWNLGEDYDKVPLPGFSFSGKTYSWRDEIDNAFDNAIQTGMANRRAADKQSVREQQIRDAVERAEADWSRYIPAPDDATLKRRARAAEVGQMFTNLAQLAGQAYGAGGSGDVTQSGGDASRDEIESWRRE